MIFRRSGPAYRAAFLFTQVAGANVGQVIVLTPTMPIRSSAEAFFNSAAKRGMPDLQKCELFTRHSCTFTTRNWSFAAGSGNSLRFLRLPSVKRHAAMAGGKIYRAGAGAGTARTNSATCSATCSLPLLFRCWESARTWTQFSPWARVWKRAKKVTACLVRESVTTPPEWWRCWLWLQPSSALICACHPMSCSSAM